MHWILERFVNFFFRIFLWLLYGGVSEGFLRWRIYSLKSMKSFRSNVQLARVSFWYMLVHCRKSFRELRQEPREARFGTWRESAEVATRVNAEDECFERASWRSSLSPRIWQNARELRANNFASPIFRFPWLGIFIFKKCAMRLHFFFFYLSFFGTTTRRLIRFSLRTVCFVQKYRHPSVKMGCYGWASPNKHASNCLVKVSFRLVTSDQNTQRGRRMSNEETPARRDGQSLRRRMLKSTGKRWIKSSSSIKGQSVLCRRSPFSN